VSPARARVNSDPDRGRLSHAERQPGERLFGVHLVTEVLARVAERRVDVALNDIDRRSLPETRHPGLIPARIELQVADAGRCSFARHELPAPRECHFRLLDVVLNHYVHVDLLLKST